MAAAGVDKASAIDVISKLMDRRASDVIAFGDMPNDIPMLEHAGYSHAVADAHQSVIDVADRLIGACESEAVASTLDDYFYGEDLTG